MEWQPRRLSKLEVFLLLLIPVFIVLDVVLLILCLMGLTYWGFFALSGIATVMLCNADAFF